MNQEMLILVGIIGFIAVIVVIAGIVDYSSPKKKERRELKSSYSYKYKDPKPGYEKSGTRPTKIEKLSFWQVLFSFDGRIGRANYFGGQLVTAMLQVAAVAFIVGLAGYSVNSLIDDLLSFSFNISRLVNNLAGYALVVVALLIVSAWIGFATLIKRLHDLNASGCLALFIPLLNIIPVVGTILYYIVIVILVFVGGTQGPNKHGVETDYSSRPATVGGTQSKKQLPKQPLTKPSPTARKAPSYIKILKDRYAAGEISTEEYREKLEVLGGDEPSTAIGYEEPPTKPKKEIRMETYEETAKRLLAEGVITKSQYNKSMAERDK